MKSVFISLITILFLSSCSSEEIKMQYDAYSNEHLVSEDDGSSGALSYRGVPLELEIENNNEREYIVQHYDQQKGDIKFRLSKVPSGLFAERMVAKDPSLSFDEIYNDIASEQVFYLEFQENQKQDLMKKYFKDDMDAAVSYMSFGIQENIRIRTLEGEIIKPNYTQYERTFHLTPYERIMINFSGLDENKEYELVYQDELFGKGEIIFPLPVKTFIQQNSNYAI